MSDKPTVIVPTLHLNGTGRNDLLRQSREACRALERAIEAMSEATPHGRDYYPQGPDATNAARNAHVARMDALRAVLAEQTEIYHAIARMPGRPGDPPSED